MQWIDTHTHIYSAEFDADRQQVVSRALNSGVSHLLMPNVDSHTIEAMMALTVQYPTVCLPMAALHPTSVKQHFEQEMTVVETTLRKTPCIAVGETGIDLYWDDAFYLQQVEAFRLHIELALLHRLPLVIHSRNALQAIFDTMEDYKASNLTGVFHCFPGDVEQAKIVLDMGFYIGVGGVVTYKNGNLAKVVEYAGLQNIILETDAPYLAPVPYRGKRNEPAFVELIGKKVAEITGTSVSQTASVTTRNAAKLFHLPVNLPAD